METTTAVKEHPILFKGHLVRAILEGRKTVTRRVMKHQPILEIDEKAFESLSGGNLLVGPDACPKGYRPARWFRFKNRRIDGLIENVRSGVCRKPTKARIRKSADWLHAFHHGNVRWSENELSCLCPYGQPGERLWVKETHYRPEAETSRCAEYVDGITKTVTAGGTVMWGHRKDIERLIGMGRVTKESIEENRGKKFPSIHMPRWASRIDLEITAVRVERINEITAQEVLREGYDWKHNQHGERCQSRTVGQFAESWDQINGPRGFGWEVNPWVWVIEFKRIVSK